MMGSRNPGRYRREGREAFIPHLSVEEMFEVNPYFPHVKWSDEYNSLSFVEGWVEAKQAYEAEEKEKEEPKRCWHCGADISDGDD